ncbi:MAG TPA: DUF512 domain-containing protein [Halanaerobiales bacterium]|nr:DUF512 domain-containing protein [Halanaerobiales bacterium]
MAEIIDVEPDSLASRKEIKPGDRIIKINNKPLHDYIDYLYQSADQEIKILVKKQNGTYENIFIKKKSGEQLGIIFKDIVFDKLFLCQNKCVFCFVDQQPDNLRETLLVKDDDYRFSFLQGSFTTLTNLSDKDLKRIIELRLSPLNISVHTTNPELRIMMMGNKRAGKIKNILTIFADNGIQFNAQIVLCPGINDGYELERTVKELLDFYPKLLSIGIVPVGLTKYRNGLVKLKPYDKAKAQEVLAQINALQKMISKETGNNLLYAADEFYLLSDQKIPFYEHYNDFPQLENGIGVTRLFWHELKEIETEIPDTVTKMNIGLLTGHAGEFALQPVINRFKKIKGLKISSIPVDNYFFGDSVTVTGLITGQDIINKLEDYPGIPDNLIIPEIMLNENKLFLDNLSISDIKKSFTEININTCSSLVELLEVINNE